MDKKTVIAKVLAKLSYDKWDKYKVYVDKNTGELKRDVDKDDFARGEGMPASDLMPAKEVRRIADELEEGKTKVYFKGSPVSRDWVAIILKARKDEII
jgi:hypothetical protein